MKKTFLKVMGITLALSLMLLSVFTGCAPKEKEPEENVPVNVVVNNAGATLPETGGIGTTIFYVLGAVLVLGAIVMLVTKKRMGTAE